MTNHEHILSFIAPHIPAATEPESPEAAFDREMQPLVETREQTERFMQQSVAYENAFAEVMRGEGEFWEPAMHLSEVDVFAAVKRALTMPCADDAQRWKYVMQRLQLLAHEYAADVASEV